jgi:hypothetical protein
MLKGLAQSHYYNRSLARKDFDEAYNYIRSFFEGPEYYRKSLTK